MGTFHCESAAVIGMGLIGGSLARALKKRGCCDEVVGIGRNRQTLELAEAMGAADRTETEIIKGVAQSDMIILATPVCSIVEILEGVLPELRPGTVVTDAGSVKGAIVAAARNSGWNREGGFVGGHPIAGTERSGVGASDPDLFDGRWAILTPDDRSSTRALEKVEAMWQAVGARTVVIEPDRHDRIVSVMSHLPHVIAYALMGVVGGLGDFGNEILKYAAGGLKDYTRIASSDPVMWRDIFATNTGPILEMIDRYREELLEIRGLMEEDAREELLDKLSDVRSTREKMLKEID